MKRCIENHSFKILLFTVIVITIFLCCSQTVSAEVTYELEFNLEHDLVFTEHYPKNHTDMIYRPVGFIMKRYRNEPVTAAGQGSVIIPCSGYQYVTQDEENPLYEYRTTIIDGDPIIEKVKQQSETWYQQMDTYPITVFMDAMMAIVENGVSSGSVSSDGVILGEVYTTYDDIKNARAWSNKYELQEYFDWKLHYWHPYIKADMEATDESVEDYTLESTQSSSYAIWAGDEDEIVFDISEGVPSGETLYLTGTTNAYHYKIGYQEICGTVTIPMDLTHRYSLGWKEVGYEVNVEFLLCTKKYYVVRDYSYTKITSVEIFTLDGIEITSDCFDTVEMQQSLQEIDCELTTYEDSVNRIEAEFEVENLKAPYVDVDTEDSRKPDYPYNDYQDLAEENLKCVWVHSDKLVIDGVTILSDEKGEGVGKTIEPMSSIPTTEVSQGGILIPRETQNGTDYQVSVQMTYASAENTLSYTNDSLETICVHTPVVLQAQISGDKSENENVTPSNRDIVIGSEFYISMNMQGQHRDILGYGETNYTKYAGNKYVSFPFEVQYGMNLYDAGSWILLDSLLEGFYLPETVQEGDYQVKVCVSAYNLSSDMNLEDVMEENANFDMKNYVAYAEQTVHIIGKLYGFTLENNGIWQAVGEKSVFPESIAVSNTDYLPMNILKIEDEDEVFRFSLYANGIGDSEDESIDIELTYFILDEEGNRKEVDVYCAKDEQFSGHTLTKITDLLKIKAVQAQLVQTGVYEFSSELHMTDKLVIVPKGQDITDINMYSEYIYWNQILIVQTDIYAKEAEVCKLSYENVENEPDGYCNMWKKEAFQAIEGSEYGDVLVIGTQRLTYPVFDVIGTH